jgi:hypothetical protein
MSLFSLFKKKRRNSFPDKINFIEETLNEREKMIKNWKLEDFQFIKIIGEGFMGNIFIYYF